MKVRVLRGFIYRAGELASPGDIIEIESEVRARIKIVQGFAVAVESEEHAAAAGRDIEAEHRDPTASNRDPGARRQRRVKGGTQ